ncbi:MAG: sulfate ABC transporter permease subunit CysT [Lachnospiraceae bacterium]
MKTKKVKRVIPGFGLSLGITLSFLSLLVIIPFASIVFSASGLGFQGFIETVTSKRVLAGYQVSFLCAFVATLFNSVFGVILSWVLVRYQFPFKRVVDGLIELPFALPTAVAGISLTALYSDQGWLGQFFSKLGIKVAYTQIGIILAMIFITIPFVVRAIQPVLEKIDSQYEEAAAILGAKRSTIFLKVIFPEILPALLTGSGLAFARALGEYGSVVFIAGNTPFKTEIAPLLIMSKLQQYDYNGATAIALVMLIISFILLLIINGIQMYSSKFTRE